MKEFDENEAISAMRATLSDVDSAKYNDDELLNLIDIIWDFYEQNGLLDIDLNDEDEEEEDVMPDLVDYAKRMIRKDKRATLEENLVEQLVAAEIDYENSLL